MKLGNISQTIVEVPKFFFDKTKDIDAFKSEYNDISTIKSSSRYFSFKKVKNILNTNLDINLNNNPRLMRISDKINKTIYMPTYKRCFTPNNQNNNETFDDNYSDRYKIIKKFLKFKKKMDLNKNIGVKIREEIMSDTTNLLDRINNDYDLTSYSKFDSRVTLNQNLNKRISIFPHRKTEKELFRKVLSNKINSLRTINPKVKEFIKKMNRKKNKFIEKEENSKNPELFKYKLETILQNTTSNLLRLKYNNKENYGYNKEDQYFIECHKSYTTRINNNIKSTIYNGFPSKTRMEFALKKKKIILPQKILRKNKNDFILKRKEYGFNSCRNEKFNKYFKYDMWSRPLHEDAFKLDE